MIAKFQKNKKGSRQHLFLPIFLGILVLLIVGFLVVSNWKIYQRKAELSSQIEILKEKARVLEERRQELQAQVSQTAEKDYLETEARERFNLKKSGEEVVTILPPEEEPAAEKEKKWWNPLTW